MTVNTLDADLYINVKKNKKPFFASVPWNVALTAHPQSSLVKDVLASEWNRMRIHPLSNLPPPSPPSQTCFIGMVLHNYTTPPHAY